MKRAITAVVAIDRGRRYGYHWYMGDVTADAPPKVLHWVGGIGWGGQRLFAFPVLDLVGGVNRLSSDFLSALDRYDLHV